jgi:hypothetical protein
LLPQTVPSTIPAAPGVPGAALPPAEAPPEASDEATPPLPRETGPAATSRQQSNASPLPLRRLSSVNRASWSDSPAPRAEALPAAWQAPLPQRVVRPATAVEPNPGFAPSEPPAYGEATDESDLRPVQR